jgi:hypothetical protein
MTRHFVLNKTRSSFYIEKIKKIKVFLKNSANYQFITKNITGQVLGVFSFLDVSLYIYLSLYISCSTQ